VIQFLWQRLLEIWTYVQENFHPIWDSLDILAVAFAVYWLLLLIRGTRAVQMLTGLLVLIAVRLISDWAQLATVGLILENFFTWGVIIIIILFQQDIRRALARMGRGFFPAVSRQEETQMLEEIVRAAQTLASKRVGALVVLERETRLDDLIEAGVRLEAVPTKELLTAIFLPYSPLHDGAVVVQDGRLTHAGCVLPLTLRSDLPEGVGTRHRAAVGITEDSDAVVRRSGTMLSVRGYGPWLTQVWINLIGNAIKYGGSPPTVEVAARATRDGMVRFEVKDNGRGIEADDQDRIFREFERVESNEEGHGLGLAIVDRVVTRLDGTTGIDDAEGGGSVFWFTVPAA